MLSYCVSSIVYGSEHGVHSTVLTSCMLMLAYIADSTQVPVGEFIAYVETVREEKLVAEYKVRGHASPHDPC